MSTTFIKIFLFFKKIVAFSQLLIYNKSETEVNTMNIGELIHNRRIALKLTLEEIGYAVGVSKSTVKKWEDGFISNMKRDKIASLAKVLKINPVSLITGELIIHTDEKEFTFTTHEKKVITAYRQQPTLQEAVDKLLGVEKEYIEVTQKEKHA